MSFLSIAGIVVGAIGVIFGIALKVKNNRISKLESENRSIANDLLGQKHKAEAARKSASIAMSAAKLAGSVSAKGNEVPKPNDDDKGTELSDEEKGIAAGLSSDPFAD